MLTYAKLYKMHAPSKHNSLQLSIVCVTINANFAEINATDALQNGGHIAPLFVQFIAITFNLPIFINTYM